MGLEVECPPTPRKKKGRRTFDEGDAQPFLFGSRAPSSSSCPATPEVRKRIFAPHSPPRQERIPPVAVPVSSKESHAPHTSSLAQHAALTRGRVVGIAKPSIPTVPAETHGWAQFPLGWTSACCENVHYPQVVAQVPLGPTNDMSVPGAFVYRERTTHKDLTVGLLGIEAIGKVVGSSEGEAVPVPNNYGVLSGFRRGFHHLTGVCPKRKKPTQEQLENEGVSSMCRGNFMPADDNGLRLGVESDVFSAREELDDARIDDSPDRQFPRRFIRPNIVPMQPVPGIVVSQPEPRRTKLKLPQCTGEHPMSDELVWMQGQEAVATDTFLHVLSQHLQVLEREWQTEEERKAFEFISKKMSALISNIKKECSPRRNELEDLRREKRRLEHENQLLQLQSVPRGSEWTPSVFACIDNKSATDFMRGLDAGLYDQKVLYRAYNLLDRELNKLKRNHELERMKFRRVDGSCTSSPFPSNSEQGSNREL